MASMRVCWIAAPIASPARPCATKGAAVTARAASKQARR
jgi:hypothetical protein